MTREGTVVGSLEPRFSARGHLGVHVIEDAAPLEPELASALAAAFEEGGAGGLVLALGARFAARPMPPAWAWLRELAATYLELVRVIPEGDAVPAMVLPEATRARLLDAPPAIVGADHLDEAALDALWGGLDATFRAGLAAHRGSVQALLGAYDPAWKSVGRVVLNLAEHRADPELPFAFMATYTTRLAGGGKAQHVPLGRALEAYVGKRQKAHLAALLAPLQRAAESCAWLAELVTSQEIFEPLRFSASEAAALLADVPKLEAAGVLVRMPRQWGGLRPPHPRVVGVVGERGEGGRLGGDALFAFDVAVTIEGEALTDEEIAALLAETSGLHFLRGRWIELDAEALARARARFEALAAELEGGVTLHQAMQLAAGADLHGLDGDGVGDDGGGGARTWGEVRAGTWLDAQLASLRAPAEGRDDDLGAALAGTLAATLRPYQEVGVRWLESHVRLGLGALLADDMGLGKTIQIIALLLLQKQRASAQGHAAERGPSLLVVPASLLGNWSSELARFAPSLRCVVAHPSALAPKELAALDPDAYDVVITTYGATARTERAAWLARRWHLVIADEAQALKNAGTRQARALKTLKAHARIALTGTPIENRLGDLWSLFDFVERGLLGSAATFTRWMKTAKVRAAVGESPWTALRELIRPYVLRRKKTDKRIIADLPDKTEVDVFCHLTRKQAALYQEAVDELAKKLAQSDGMQRRGAVLATLSRLKQICNHPSQWLGDGDWALGDSGKLARLAEIADVVRATQEKVLVFTQFREITALLGRSLAAIFGAPGLVLTGETKVAERKQLVARFQEDEAIPFFVLSLKAGGTGLNLTAASHVVHFDRWWNPAVEDQATDRAFRIGQKKNVLVHKLVCRGTLEENIAALIRDKRALVGDVIEEGAEVRLTELDDEALLSLLRLDLRTALGEG